MVVLSEADTGRINKDRGGFLVSAKPEEPKKAEPKEEPEPRSKSRWRSPERDSLLRHFV